MSRNSQFNRCSIQLRRSFRGHNLTINQVQLLSLPATALDTDGFRQLVQSIREAHGKERSVIVIIGGHPIKLGLSRFLIDLMDRDWIAHLATNGAGISHDFELALVGGTSEDVAKWIQRGQFCLWQEPGRLNDIMRHAANRAKDSAKLFVPYGHN